MTTLSRRDRERIARRQAILDAAEPLVFQRGFAATKMDDVATAAELSKGTVYLYFENKSSLCAAIAERALGTLIPQIQTALESQTTGLDKVRAQFQVVSEFMVARPSMIRLMVGWLLEGSEAETDNPSFHAYRARIAELQMLAAGSFEQGKSDGSIRRELDTIMTGIQLWGSFLGNLLLIASQEEMARRLPAPVDIESGLDTMLDIIIAGLRPYPPGST